MFRWLIPAFSAAVIPSISPAQSCQPHWADDLWGTSPPGEVRALFSHDDGTGQRLYVGSSTIAPTATGGGAIAVWDRIRFRMLGSTTGIIASAPAGIYAIAMATTDPYHPVARFTGQTWALIPSTVIGGEVRALASCDSGTGPHLVATGRFQYINNVAVNHIARWAGGAWSPLGAGLQSDAAVGGLSLAVTGSPGAQDLWVGGQFLSAGNQLAGHIARWKSCHCYPDCNNDGALTVADFGCFQSRYMLGEPYADCTAGGGFTVADFGCFQTAFVAGCP